MILQNNYLFSSQGLQVKISKLQNEIARLTAEKGLGEPDPVRPSPKYSFNLKKPEGSGRTVLPHTKDDQYFERTSRAPEQLREPRSERGEREYRIEPDTYHSPQRGEVRSKWEAGSGKKAYRNKTYRPPYPFKRWIVRLDRVLWLLCVKCCLCCRLFWEVLSKLVCFE